ncbi:M20 family metallopeptidase [Pseudomonas alkylphenolica]|uniref:M20 family metallopeptidase n=1 Tax=Pseudomonas alkylphenolica TaxID=237609 RepID=UPI0018D72A90|nr:M20 family metallopeptidase [Pseudomonas alkylphenolica]MBH3426390.1 M20 family metallopeptidase [Pseudomonas alkylphenolica]
MKTKALLLAGALFSASSAQAAAAPLNPTEQAMVRFIEQRYDSQVALLEQLVNINSGTGNRRGVEQVGEVLRPYLEQLGFQTRWFDLPEPMTHAGSLVATLGGTGRRILLIAHLDTVFGPQSPFQTFQQSTDQQTASGPGVVDNKGGLVTLLYALKALDQAGRLSDASITVVLVGDEEQAAQPGSISRKALRDAAMQSEIALGLEFASTSHALVTGRRGISAWQLSSHGQSRHSSFVFSPHAGFGAIYETARVLEAMRIAFSGQPGLSVNPGIVAGGRTADLDIQQNTARAEGLKNIIAGQAQVHGDLRFLSQAQQREAEQALRDIAAASLPGTSSTLQFNDIMPAMPETPGNRQLLAQFSEINEALGRGPLQAVPAVERGGADIAYVADLVDAGIDGLGPWGTGAHSDQETLELAALPVVTQRLAIFISRFIGR